MRGRIDWERGFPLGATLGAGTSYSWEGSFLGDVGCRMEFIGVCYGRDGLNRLYEAVARWTSVWEWRTGS